MTDYPDQARAACFSPDGKKVAFTYLNRFVHQLCMADWTGNALASPLNLVRWADGPRDNEMDNTLSTSLKKGDKHARERLLWHLQPVLGRQGNKARRSNFGRSRFERRGLDEPQGVHR